MFRPVAADVGKKPLQFFPLSAELAGKHGHGHRPQNPAVSADRKP